IDALLPAAASVSVNGKNRFLMVSCHDPNAVPICGAISFDEFMDRLLVRLMSMPIGYMDDGDGLKLPAAGRGRTGLNGGRSVAAIELVRWVARWSRSGYLLKKMKPRICMEVAAVGWEWCCRFWVCLLPLTGWDGQRLPDDRMVKMESSRHPHAFDRIRSSDLTVTGGGCHDSLMEKMEHWISVL
ncbi:hypothetical protein ACLOJK_023945, partial [Asimina triloba]